GLGGTVPATTAPTNRVSGTVFSDINRNVVQDPGEPSLRGYTVEVIGANGRQTATTGLATNPGGFAFDNVADGSYLNVILPAGAERTTPAGTGLQFAASPELGFFGPLSSTPPSADFRAANLQGKQGAPDLI